MTAVGLGLDAGTQADVRVRTEDLKAGQRRPIVAGAAGNTSVRERSGSGHTSLPQIITTPISLSTKDDTSPPDTPSLKTSGLFARSRSHGSGHNAHSTLNIGAGSDGGLQETRKLLSYLLDRLESRPSCPDLFARFGHEVGHHDTSNQSGLEKLKASAAAVISKQGIGSDARGRQRLDQWDTESLVDLVNQLLGLLTLARKQSLALFHPEPEDLLPPRSPGSSTGATPSPVNNQGRFLSMSPRPSAQAVNELPHPPVDVSQLLRRLVRTLSSLITTDCLHQVQRPRPLMPPNSLQAVCLSLASCLLDTVHGDDDLSVEIMQAVTPAFHTFPPEVAERLCAWFEGAIGDVLSRLETLRGDLSRRNAPWIDPNATRADASSASIPFLAFTSYSEAGALPVGEAGWKQWASPVDAPPSFGLVSSHTPGLSSSVYRLASVVPRLIHAVTSSISLASAPLTLIHRLHRLMAILIKAKPDLSLDLLEITAYGSQAPRHSALSMLATFWPKSMGHVVTAKPLPLTTYEVDLYRWEAGRELAPSPAKMGHEYLPWRVDGLTCAGCNTAIDGFAVSCLLCHETLHLNCYNTRSQVISLPPILGQGSSAPSAIKLSHVLRPSRATSDVADEMMQTPTRRMVGQHHLVLANLFTLSLCDRCGTPLWGLSAQGYTCTAGCGCLFHLGCLDQLGQAPPCKKTKKRVSIRSDDFRRSFENYYRDILVTPETMTSLPVDEVAIGYGRLWTQLELLENGLAHSSLVVQSKLGDRIGADDLDLPLVVRQYEETLEASQSLSDALQDYVDSTSSPRDTLHRYLFSRPFLSFITALLRSPTLLSANHIPLVAGKDSTRLKVQSSAEQETPENLQTFQQLPCATLREVLKRDFGITTDHVADFLLNYLHHLGYFQQLGAEVDLNSRRDNLVTFHLPSLLDATPDVELLIATIEVSLNQLDLAANEHALLLLRRQAWPTVLCADYALTRLTRALVQWVLNEEVHLREAIENFASRHLPVPGVRVPPESSGGVTTTSMALYQEGRRRLLHVYATDWLQTLHDLDPERYDDDVFEIVCLESSKPPISHEAASRVLGNVCKLSEVGVTFSGHAKLVCMWFHSLHDLMETPRASVWQSSGIKSLAKLMHAADASDDISNNTRQRITDSISTEGGVDALLSWYHLLALSGVSLTELEIQGIADIVSAQPLSHLRISHLAEICRLHVHAMRWLSLALCKWLELQDWPKFDAERDHTLALVLGCLLRCFQEKYDQLPSSLQVSDYTRTSDEKPVPAAPSDFLQEAPRLWHALTALIETPAATARLVASFCSALLTKLGNNPAANAVLFEISSKTCQALWTHLVTAANRKPYLNLLLLVTARRPGALLQCIPEPTEDSVVNIWQVFLDLVELDARSNSRAWRSAAVDLVFLLLDSLMPQSLSVAREDLRRSILPTHLAFMTTCIEDRLIRSNIQERIRILERTDRHRHIFQSRPAIGWAALETLATERTLCIKELEAEDGATELLIESQVLRSKLIAMALDSMSDGIRVSAGTHARMLIQAQYALDSCGEVYLLDALKALAPSLSRFLDSPIHVHEANNGQVEIDHSPLLGWPLRDPVLRLVSCLEFDRVSFALQRHVLDALMCIFFKHTVGDDTPHVCAALQALSKMICADVPTEIRLQGVTVLRTAFSRCEKTVTRHALTDTLTTLSEMVISKASADDASVVDAVISLLRYLFDSFSSHGVFLLFLKSPSAMAHRLAEVLQALFGDKTSPSPTLSADKSTEVLTHVTQGLLRATSKTSDVSLVLTNLAHYVTQMSDIPASSIDAFGDFLPRLGRYVADWSHTEYDPNHVLRICTVLLQTSTGSSLFLNQTATLLLLSLHKHNVDKTVLNDLSRAAAQAARSGQVANMVKLVVHEQLVAITAGISATDQTMEALLQLLINNATSGTADRQLSATLLSVAPGCLNLLHRMPRGPGDPDLAVRISYAASKIIMLADSYDEKTLALVTEALVDQAAAVQLRVLGFILASAAAQTEIAELKIVMARLLRLLPITGRAISLAFKASADLLISAERLEEGAELLTRAFVVCRACLLVILRFGSGPDDDVSFWHKIWPDLERLLYMSLHEQCRTSALRATLHTSFLDLLLMLPTVAPLILATHGKQFLTILNVLQLGTLSPKKLLRTEAAMVISTTPRVSLESHLTGLHHDMCATERLLALRYAPNQ